MLLDDINLCHLCHDGFLSQLGPLNAERADLPGDVFALRLRYEVWHEFVDASARLLRHQVADLLGHVDCILEGLRGQSRILFR